MVNIGRLIAVIAAVLLVVGAAVFLLFRSSIASEGMYRLAPVFGLEAAAPERHVVPGGFRGWVVVHYGVEDSPALPKEGDTLVVEYPATGRLETSTQAPDDKGLIQRVYYRRTAHGLRPLSRVGEIWGEYSHISFSNDGSGTVYHSAGFFVGSMKEFLDAEWPKEHASPTGARN